MALARIVTDMALLKGGKSSKSESESVGNFEGCVQALGFSGGFRENAVRTIGVSSTLETLC